MLISASVPLSKLNQHGYIENQEELEKFTALDSKPTSLNDINDDEETKEHREELDRLYALFLMQFLDKKLNTMK